MDKTLKCYEKALSINPCDNETGAALSDLYRILGKHVSISSGMGCLFYRIN